MVKKAKRDRNVYFAELDFFSYKLCISVEEKKISIFLPAKPNTSEIIYHQALCSSKKGQKIYRIDFFAEKGQKAKE